MGEEDERTALLGIIAVNDRFLIVDALLPEGVGRIRQDISVNRHMMLRLLLSYQRLRGDFPEFFQCCAIIPFHQILTRGQCFVKKPV